MSAPRVLFTGPHPERPGGVSALVAAIRDEAPQIDFLPVGRRHPRDVLAMARDLRAVRRLRPTHRVLHVNPSLRSRALLRDGALVRAWPGPSVAWIHGWDDRLARRLEGRAVFQRVFARTHLAALGPPFAEGLVQLGIPRERIAIIPPCWKGTPLPRAPERGRVLFLGRIEEEKGVLALIEALRGLDARLVFAGSGSATGACQERAARLGVPLELAGWVTGAAKWRELARAELVVLPSREEGVPVALLEAMAAGVPTIATSVGGVPWLSDGGRAIDLVEPGAPCALRDAIVGLLEDSDKRHDLALAAAERAARFHVSVVVSELEALWARVAAS